MPENNPTATPRYPMPPPGYPMPPTYQAWTWPSAVWPDDQIAADRRTAWIGLIAAGLIAIVLPFTPTGVGYPLVATLTLAVVFIAQDRRPSVHQVVTGLGTLALATVPALRSAGWLDGLCLALAVVSLTVTWTGGRTWTGLGLGSIAIAFTPLRAARWLLRGVARRGTTAVSPIRAGFVGVIAVGSVAVFATLFAQADAAYDNVVHTVLPAHLGGRFAIFLLAAFTLMGLGYLAVRPPMFDELSGSGDTTIRRWEWATPLALLDLLFASFVVVQLATLFGGRDHVVLTSGLTYAEYARQGFWQLLTVTVLTLLVVAICVRVAGRGTRSDRIWLRALLGPLAGLALVIVASALHRMSLYEKAFGYTRLRVFVSATELWLGLVFVLVLFAGVRLSGRWLPRTVLATAMAGVVGLAGLNPDAFIAQHNLDRYRQTGRIDVSYLGRLSPDAVPSLLRLPLGVRGCVLSQYTAPLAEHRSWNELNLGLSQARNRLRGQSIASCTGP